MALKTSSTRRIGAQASHLAPHRLPQSRAYQQGIHHCDCWSCTICPSSNSERQAGDHSAVGRSGKVYWRHLAEIAGLTRRNCEYHMGEIFRKPSVPTRGQAIAALMEVRFRAPYLLRREKNSADTSASARRQGPVPGHPDFPAEQADALTSALAYSPGAHEL